jgi:tRNA A37 threonylcarbamoyladenosine synthetase subunit TsaC/SUA5/YrdC
MALSSSSSSFVPLESLRRSARFRPSDLSRARRKLLTVQTILLSRYQCRDILTSHIVELETQQTILRRMITEEERASHARASRQE